jgi:hypothetical protein
MQQSGADRAVECCTMLLSEVMNRYIDQPNDAVMEEKCLLSKREEEEASIAFFSSLGSEEAHALWLDILYSDIFPQHSIEWPPTQLQTVEETIQAAEEALGAAALATVDEFSEAEGMVDAFFM